MPRKYISLADCKTVLNEFGRITGYKAVDDQRINEVYQNLKSGSAAEETEEEPEESGTTEE